MSVKRYCYLFQLPVFDEFVHFSTENFTVAVVEHPEAVGDLNRAVQADLSAWRCVNPKQRDEI